MIGSDQLVAQLLQNLRIIEQIQERLDPSRLAEYQALVKAAPDYSAHASALAAIELPEAQAFPQKLILKAAAQITKGKETLLTAAPGQAGSGSFKVAQCGPPPTQLAVIASRSMSRIPEAMGAFCQPSREGQAEKADGGRCPPNPPGIFGPQ